MKRSTLSLMIICVLGICFPNHLPAQRISKTYNNVSLSEALLQLQNEQTTYSINFLYNELEDFRITTTITRRTIPDAIQQMIGFYPVSMIVKSEENEIYVECTHKTDRHLTGTIVDEQDKPVAFANIAVLNPIDSTIISGGVSNESGYFVIPYETPSTVERNILIRISYVGYKTIFRNCKQPEVGKIKMQPDNYTINGVVVKGERPKIQLQGNSLIMNSDSSLIAATNSNMIIENSCLMNSAGALLELAGGAYDVTHCTLANYNYWAAFSRCDVVMRNYQAASDSTRLWCPLYRCNFTNSIIYGNSGMDPNIDANGYTAFVDEAGVRVDSIYNYRLDHCLVHSTSGFDDDDCIAILWDADPLYLLVDMPNYICDPHLQAESPCIAVGEPRTVARLPFDRDGHPRAPQPSLGCYEP